jgi:cystathionine beta-lyase/cystathionine gamma-synthase
MKPQPPSSLAPSTLLLSAMGGADPSGPQPNVPPLYQSVGYELTDLAALEQAVGGQRHLYVRHGAPNEEAAARLLAQLEARGGPADLQVESTLLSSGMAAIEAAVMAVLDEKRVGSRDRPPLVVMASPIYSAARSLLCALANRGLMTLHELEVPDTAAVAAIAEREPVALIYCEVLTNPRLRVPDLPALGALASQHGATLIVDATLATPLLCRPLTLGAHLVVHSATKFLGGHGDLCAGVVAGRPDLIERVRAHRQLHGSVLDPFAAWLLQRSLRTLDVRLKRQIENAGALATFLSQSADRLGIREVIYPGLPSHPDHALAAKLLDRPGAMLAFTLKTPEAARRTFERVRLLRRVASLGDVESLIMYPAATWSRSLSPKELARFGIAPGLLRLSVGIEDIADLQADLQAALQAD